MKKKHIIFLIIFLVITLSTIGFYLLKRSMDSSTAFKVDTYTISSGEKVFINGVIMPESSEEIYLDPAKGDVDKIYVKNGQSVKKGDKLLTYRNSQVTDQITQINLQINSAENQRKRLSESLQEAKEQLLALENQAKSKISMTAESTTQTLNQSATTGLEGQISAYNEQLIAINDQISGYREQLKFLKEREQSTVTASIEGMVLLDDSGNKMGSPYITIESTSFYIKGSINEKEQPKLKENQEVEILILSTGRVVKGKVSLVGNRPVTPSASMASPMGGDSNISHYEVSIAFDSQENLTNGFHVQATVKLKNDNVKIPRSAILKENDKSYVFKDVNKKAVKQEITYTEGEASEVVVSSGLNENDRIVTNPAQDMKEGMSLE